MNISELYVVGDSISKGIVQNIEVGKRYSVYEDCFWNVFCRKHNITLTNKSVFGATIEKGHRQLEKDLAKGITSDIVVIEFGGNDSDFRWPELFTKGPDTFHANTLIDSFLTHLKQMVSMVKQAGKTPVLMSLPPLVAERYFNTISEGLDKQALLEWMHDPYFLYREQELYSLTITQYAKENQIHLLDVRSQFLNKRNSPELMCEDGIHPNKEGHAFIATYLDSILSCL